jgi:hypothetical protein
MTGGLGVAVNMGDMGDMGGASAGLSFAEAKALDPESVARITSGTGPDTGNGCETHPAAEAVSAAIIARCRIRIDFIL